MSEKELKQQIEELKEINKALETQLHQIYNERDAKSDDDLITDYQQDLEKNN